MQCGSYVRPLFAKIWSHCRTIESFCVKVTKFSKANLSKMVQKMVPLANSQILCVFAIFLDFFPQSSGEHCCTFSLAYFQTRRWSIVYIQMQWCHLISLHFQLFTSQFRGIPAHPSARFGWTSTKMPLRHCLSQAGISMVSKPKVLVSPQLSYQIKRLLQIT